MYIHVFRLIAEVILGIGKVIEIIYCCNMSNKMIHMIAVNIKLLIKFLLQFLSNWRTLYRNWTFICIRFLFLPSNFFMKMETRLILNNLLLYYSFRVNNRTEIIFYSMWNKQKTLRIIDILRTILCCGFRSRIHKLPISLWHKKIDIGEGHFNWLSFTYKV